MLAASHDVRLVGPPPIPPLATGPLPGAYGQDHRFHACTDSSCAASEHCHRLGAARVGSTENRAGRSLAQGRRRPSAGRSNQLAASAPDASSPVCNPAPHRRSPLGTEADWVVDRGTPWPYSADRPSRRSLRTFAWFLKTGRCPRSHHAASP